MNKVILTGRLTAEPKVTYKDTLAIAKYGLAVDRKTKKEGADFLNCVSFGKQGEFIEKYLHKGTKIALTGRLQTGSYEKDGVKHYTTDIITEEIEFAESKRQQENSEQPATGNDDFMNIPDGIDELPFK